MFLGLGFRVFGLGFRVFGLGFRVFGLVGFWERVKGVSRAWFVQISERYWEHALATRTSQMKSLGSQSVSACLGLRTEGSGYSVTELLFEGMALCRAVAMIVTRREWFQCSRILCSIPRHVIPRALRFKFSLSVCDMRRKGTFCASTWVS